MEQSNGDNPEKPRPTSDHRLAQPSQQQPQQQQPQPQQPAQQQLQQQQQQQQQPQQPQHSKRRIKETSCTEETPKNSEFVQLRKPSEGVNSPVDAVVKKRRVEGPLDEDSTVSVKLILQNKS
ncbi:putative uncharacterized protein DDB_G0294196 isoform X3 [Drosophila hydei]|uniref:Uncharacterized protein n=1 Tax=Drosophila hydei TaxID=7224 RepID=A0A6J1LGF4_DROHY|nr:putative uncharacterized protein DDB_G0294196 isoform X3 [Drosophila hydei]